MNYIALWAFIKKFDSYEKQEQESISKTLEKIKNYLETNQAPHGLRIKKLSKNI